MREPQAHRGRWTPLLLLTVLAAACSSTLHDADHAWDAGKLTTAASGYQSLLNQPEGQAPRDQLLFRLALTYLDSTSPLHSPARALATLQELVDTYPTSSYRRPAEIVASLVQDVDEAEDDLVCLLNERDAYLDHAQKLGSTVEDDQRKLADLEAKLQAASAELDRARHALDGLKGIDLGSAHP